jgi:CheY-like chemotaxis protein
MAKGKLVLVADDHPVNREVLRRHMGSHGYPVDLVTDCEEAWEKALSNVRLHTVGEFAHA